MNLIQLFRILRKAARTFSSATEGNIGILFGLALVPLLGSVGMAVDYSRANSIKSAMQSGLDTTALNIMKAGVNSDSTQITSQAVKEFPANFNRPEASNIQISAQYNSSNNVLTMTGSADVPAYFVTVFGKSNLTVNTSTKVALRSENWPVCVIVTDPTSNHTLLVKNQARIDFTNCLVQVNTQNWDAVEARDTSYIRSANGVNCFTGDIHYGDVTPPKQLTCSMFDDPFSSYNVPTRACDFTNRVVNSNETLAPGTYCGGINITGSVNVIFSPGVYYIQDGDLKILGSSNVTAKEVTFLISGTNSNLDISTTGTITMSPSGAGQWAGFLFYYDQPSSTSNKKGSKAGKNTIASATMNISGVIYLVGQTLNITHGANVTVNPGTIIADFILPDGGYLNLTGTVNSPTAVQQAMRKSLPGRIPVIIQ